VAKCGDWEAAARERVPLLPESAQAHGALIGAWGHFGEEIGAETRRSPNRMRSITLQQPRDVVERELRPPGLVETRVRASQRTLDRFALANFAFAAPVSQAALNRPAPPTKPARDMRPLPHPGETS
jgi:hypothetical protein